MSKKQGFVKITSILPSKKTNELLSLSIKNHILMTPYNFQWFIFPSSQVSFFKHPHKKNDFKKNCQIKKQKIPNSISQQNGNAIKEKNHI